MTETLVEEIKAAPPRFAAAVETAVAPAPAAALAVAPEILDGGEIVILAVKPSLWFVLFDSIRWLLLGALLLGASLARGWNLPQFSARTVGQFACLLIVVRLGAALLRWTSRLYVLTNRRVMRMQGVFRPVVASCALREISATNVQVAAYERPFGLGAICIFTEATPDADLHWRHVARCDDVHAEVRKAIDRAQNGSPRV